MRFIVNKIIFAFLLIFIFSISSNFVFADNTCSCKLLPGGSDSSPVCADPSGSVVKSTCTNRSGTPSCSCTYRGTGGLVPCIDDCNVNDILGNSSNYASSPPIWTSLMRTALGVSGILILCLFIYGGISMIISRGEKAKISEAVKIMKSSVYGLILVFFAYTIVKFITIAIVGNNWKIFFGGGS